MNKNYYSIYKNASVSFVINKSEFISHSKYVESEEEALNFIDEMKEKYADATHNCSCYIIGADKLIQRFSDDGEPSGTAGLPMLEVCKSNNLTNICIVVTRYFGGIKLGAGGLIRAYSRGAADVIKASVKVLRKEFVKMSVTIDYTNLGIVEDRIVTGGYYIKDKNYTDKVEILLYIDMDQKDEFKENLMNLTGGEAIFREDGSLFLPTKDGKLLF